MVRHARRDGEGPITALDWGAGWLGRRARNVKRRPESFGIVAAVASVAAFVTLLLIPHGAVLLAPAPPNGVAGSERPDTMALVAAEVRARVRLREAEAALDSSRAALARRLLPPLGPVDTLPPVLRARRDSLAVARATLARLLRRAKVAPLPASYRALAEAPPLRGEARIRILLDSLVEIERSRQSLGAAGGGVDPIFVALTERASEIGKEITAVAASRLALTRRELAKLQPMPSPSEAVALPPIDTLSLIAARDSVRRTLTLARDTLAHARLLLQSVDERSRGIAAVAAASFTNLVAALVLGLAAAFAVAIIRELWRPRIADAREAELVARGATLGCVRRHPSAPELARRKADREVAPLIDPVTDTFRLIYTALADQGLNLPIVAVIGDSTAVTATVAANLAAAAAHHARSTLLLDTDGGLSSVAAVLRLRAAPGLVDIVAEGAEWSEAVVAATVGRDRQIEVIPAGRPGARPVLPGSTAKFESLLAHVRRRYDTVIVSAPPPGARLESARVVAGVVGGVILCARTGRTRVGAFARMASMVRAAGGEVRGIVLWEADDPALPESESGRAAPATTAPLVV